MPNIPEYWPRVGYPLLPAAYRKAWFEEPLPSAVVHKVGLPIGATFADLDRSVWERVRHREALRLVANHVLAVVTRRLYFGSDSYAADLPILGYQLPQGTELETLPFSNRTLNALRGANKLRDLEWVSRVNAREFLSLPSAGARTLLDFATVLEEHYSKAFVDDGQSQSESLAIEVLAACDKLGAQFPISTISARDPRLCQAGLVSSADEMLAKWKAQARVSSVDELEHILGSLSQIRTVLLRIKSQTLDAALDELLTSVANGNYVAALAARWGWDGNGGCTLEEAAKIRGVTRERIRQVEQSTLKKIPRGAFLPALDSAITVLADAAAAFEPDAASLLREAGLVARSFKLHGVWTAAKILGRLVDFEVSSDGQTVQKAGDEHIGPIRDAVKSLANTNHVASVSELQARIRDGGFESISEESTRRILTGHPRTVWLDRDRQWFWLQQKEGRNRYINAARKVLSVAEHVRVDILRDGVLRHHRSRGMSLPIHVFEGLCRAAGFDVSANVVSSSELLHPRDTLAQIELIIYEILRQHDNALGLHELRDACVKAGVNRHSFYVYLSYSPITRRLAPSIWTLRGTDVDPVRVSRLLEEAPARKRPLRDHGWTSDGAIWVAYEVSLAIMDSGVITIPSGVQDVLGDAKFELYAVDGARMGTLSIKKSSAWGLGPFIGRRGVDIGDHLIVAIDVELQMGVLHVGPTDVLETFQDGEGWGPRRLLSNAPMADVEE